MTELIKHGLLGIRETIGSQAPEGLTIKNCSVAVVGENQVFHILDATELQVHLNSLEEVAPPPAASTTTTTPGA